VGIALHGVRRLQNRIDLGVIVTLEACRGPAGGECGWLGRILLPEYRSRQSEQQECANQAEYMRLSHKTFPQIVNFVGYFLTATKSAAPEPMARVRSNET
jgi:hypothetical protein